jgi:hypothetical protein
MTRRELGWAVSALTIGLAVGALLLRHCESSAPAPREAAHEDPVTENDPPDDTRAAPPDAPLDPVPDADDTEPSDTAVTDAATEPDGPSHKKARLRLRNLYIRPVGDDRLCVNISPGSGALELLACRGHRGTERWTFEEDLSGTSRIRGHDGGCFRIGPVNARGEPTVEVAPCAVDTPRFRHAEDRRLEEVHSGQCVTARTVGKHAQIVLAVCDANARSGVQTWALTP